jgi:RHS repeat-associated protein
VKCHEGAGGIAGLLRTRLHSPTGSADYYPTYDANGNVSEYVDSTGSVVAHYEYSPFGRGTVASGTMASSFAFRFSTKYVDTETALYYYGYRYYDPRAGRWLSRDPIGEIGGSNLRTLVDNAPLKWVDPLGWWPFGSGNIDLTGGGGTQILPRITLPRLQPARNILPKVLDAPIVDLGIDILPQLKGILPKADFGDLGAVTPQQIADRLKQFGLDKLQEEFQGALKLCATIEKMTDGGWDSLSDEQKKFLAAAVVIGILEEMDGWELPEKGRNWRKLKGDQGWLDKDGNTWKKDKLHKDHWDVSDRKGKKIREVDFEGNQIWPNGPKNKNKR